MVLTGTQDAADTHLFVDVRATDILNSSSASPTASGAFTDVLQKSQSAEFTLDGVALTRNTNDISDVLTGVTFDLLQPTPAGTTLNISIDTDTSQIADRAADLRHQLQRLPRST